MQKVISQSSFAYKLLGRSFLIISILLAAACSTAPIQKGDTQEEAVFSADDLYKKERIYQSEPIYDPWEGFNRSMYNFNYRFDKYVFLPTVEAYEYVMPDTAEQGVTNFYNNFRQIGTLLNCILQGEGAKAMDTTARLILNTTLGVFGLFDWASDIGIPYHQEDFGQTLGVWGVDSGPYLVLPILGPSSVRDGAGLGVDFVVSTEIRDELINLSPEEKIAWGLLDAVDTRSNISFRYYETGSPFEYEWVRLLYNTKRKLDIEK